MTQDESRGGEGKRKENIQQKTHICLDALFLERAVIVKPLAIRTDGGGGQQNAAVLRRC